MTSGDDSLQAVMHQVPFSAKHVMGALPPRISGIFTDYFHHFFSLPCLLLTLSWIRKQEEEQRSQARGSRVGGLGGGGF